jgi:hypothetical protein
VFIFEGILCRWGALEEIVTDNGLAFMEALNWLAEQYGCKGNLTNLRREVHLSLAKGNSKRML